MPEEAQGQAEAKPEEAGSGEVEETSQAIDYAALEKQIAELGDGYTPENIAEKVADLKKGMNEAQRKASETQRKYEHLDPVLDYMQQDPKFSDGLQEWVKEYFEGSEVSKYGDVSQDVSRALDPIYQKMNQWEVERAGEKMDREIEKLKSEGMEINDEIYNQIMGRIKSVQDIDNIRAFAWEAVGPSMAKKAAKQAAEEVIGKLKQNSSSYTPTPSGTSGEAKFDSSSMSQSELDDMLMKELEEKMSSG